MANSIDLVTKFLPLLDEVYQIESKTAILDINPKRVQFDGSSAVKVFKTTMDGMGSYGRNTGYVAGDVTGTWETLTLAIDRGRSFTIDRMDNEESLAMAFGTLAGEFLRNKVVPEIDAYRFAKYAGTASILTAAGATLTAATVVAAIDAATRAMDDAGVPEEGRVIYMTPEIYTCLKNSTAVSRFVPMGSGIDRRFEEFDGMKVIKVPQARFYTAITLYDGVTGGQTAGGFVKGAAKDVNFMIVHPNAVLQITKHAIPRVFDPDVNQSADAWKFDYRIYHDAWVYDNKVNGIYLHKKA